MRFVSCRNVTRGKKRVFFGSLRRQKASRALGALLTDEARASVLRYFHVRDAKMALASLLLKHLVVARCAGVDWEHTRLTRDEHTKPVYREPEDGSGSGSGSGPGSGSCRPVAFNVSHQAGLVVLAAVYGGDERHGADVGGFFDVGVDIVAPSERRGRDHKIVADEGSWGRFVDMHADVFAAGEGEYLKHQVLSVVSPGRMPPRRASPEVTPAALPGVASNSLGLSSASSTASAFASTSGSYPSPGPGPATNLLDLKLRCFYTLWCLREAYVKMTGEALLAPWLSELEFRRFQPPPPLPSPLPSPRSPTSLSTDLRQDAAATVTTHDIRFRGRAVDDVNMCLRALGDDYMACTAIRTPAEPAVALGLVIGPFEVLSLRDILDFADRFHGEDGSKAAAQQPSGR